MEQVAAGVSRTVAGGRIVSDEEFIHAFEACTLAPDSFTHAAHVRAGWCYLTRYTLGEAIDRFRASLRAYAASLGAAGKYHETVTVAWMLLIAERISDGPESWDDFATRCPELFDRRAMLARYYTDEVLQSERAKQRFVMPDRITR